MNRFIVKEFIEGNYFEREIRYGVYEYIENTYKHIHTNEDLCNLVVVCHNELIAEKIAELLNLDNYIEENKKII